MLNIKFDSMPVLALNWLPRLSAELPTFRVPSNSSLIFDYAVGRLRARAFRQKIATDRYQASTIYQILFL